MLRMILALTVASTGATTPPAGAETHVTARESSLRRVVALLDYVAGDYAHAVGEGGKILSADEHREQIGFVGEAVKELRAEGGAEALALARKTEALTSRVKAADSPAAVSADARALRDEV